MATEGFSSNSAIDEAASLKETSGLQPVDQAEQTNGNMDGKRVQIAQAASPAQPDTDQPQAQPATTRITVGDDAVARLPEGTSVESIEISGNDILLRQPDGSVIVIVNGVLSAPTIFIGAVQLPSDTLAAAFQDAGVQPAAGPNASSGGAFIVPPGPIGDPFDITDLLPPTAFGFQPLPPEELFQPLLEDREPLRIISINPAPPVVEDPALPVGTNAPSNAETDTAAVEIAAGSSNVVDLRFGADVSGIEVRDSDGNVILDENGNPVAFVFVALDAHTLVGRVDGVDVIQLTIALPPGGIPAGTTDFGTITVDLLSGFPHQFGVDSNNFAIISGIPIEGEDGDSNVATADTSVNVLDDVPFVAAQEDPRTPTAVLDETIGGGDTPDDDTVGLSLVPGETPIGEATILAAAVGGLFTTPVFGADGPLPSGGDTAYSLTDSSGGSLDGALTGLFLTGNGSQIALVQVSPTLLEGRAGGAGGDIAFALSIDTTTGQVSVQQFAAIDHGADGNDFDSTQFLSDVLFVTLTITDGDGDVASATSNIALSVAFQDDGPTLTVAADERAAAALAIELDETVGAGDLYNAGLGETEDAGGNANTDDGVGLGRVTTAVSGGLTALFAIGGAFGSDGPGTLSATLGFVGLPVDGTPVATTLSATDGGPIALVYVSATQINGVDASGSGDVVFTIEIVGAPGAEQLQTTLFEAIDHGSDGNLYDSELVLKLAGDGALRLQYEVTRSDGDGDTVTEADQIDLATANGGLISFDDDGPVGGENITARLEDDDLPGGLDGGPGDDGAPQATTGTAAHDFGSDGPGSVTLIGATLPDGLGFSVAVNGDGSELIISQIQGGAPVEVLKVTINTASGAYEVTQLAAMHHPFTDEDGANDGPQTAWEDNLGFRIAYRVTDGDGDFVDDDFGVNVDDDSPEVRAVTVGSAVTLDETDAGTAFANGPIMATSATAIISATLLFGADGAAANPVVYTLSLSGDGSTTLTTAVGDFPITLVETDADTITGTYVDGNGDTQTAFTVDILADGKLMVTQNAALEHANPNDPNDPLTLDGLITARVTITDADGDSDTSSAEIGGAVTFLDDGPAYVDASDGFIGNIAGQVHGTMNFSFGADGPGQIMLAPLNSITGVTYGTPVATADGGYQIEATTLTSSGVVTFFTMTWFQDGTYVFDLVTPRPTVESPNILGNFNPGAPVFEVNLADGSFFDGLFFNTTTGAIQGAISDPDSGSGNNSDALNISGGGFGLGSASDVPDNKGFMFGQQGADSFSFTADLTPNASNVTISWAAYSGPTAPTSSSVPQQIGAFTNITADQLINIDPAGAFDWIVVRIDVISGTGQPGVRIQNPSYTKSIAPGDTTVSFAVTTTDSDGDSVLSDNTSDAQTINIFLAGNTTTTFNGDGGDEWFVGTAAAETFNAGGGSDTISYVHSSASVNIDLGSGTASGGHAQGDILNGIDNIVGSSLGDVLVGDAGDNILDGGTGVDTLTGGDGADTFVLANLDIADLITDYDFADGDVIDLTSLFDVGDGVDPETAGFVRLNGTSLDVDTDGGGNSYVSVATFAAPPSTVTILYSEADDTDVHTTTLA